MLLRRLALGLPLLLAACGSGAPAVPAASPSPSPSLGSVTVYAHPRPKSLELPYIRILGVQEANLRWPSVGLHLEMIGATDALDLQGAPLPDRRAGEEYVVAYVGAAPSGWSARRFTDAVVKVGGAAHPVPAFDQGTFIIVAAPEQAVVRLEVTDTERMQWVDLRTASVGNVIPGYDPRLRDGASIECDIASPSAAVDDTSLVLLTGVTLEPWVEGRGWARTGRIWFDLRLRLWYSRDAVAFDLDGPASVTLTGPEGGIPVTVPLAVGGATEQDPHMSETELIADVPADITVAQLAFHPKGTVAARGTAVARWTASCETLRDAYTFTR